MLFRGLKNPVILSKKIRVYSCPFVVNFAAKSASKKFVSIRVYSWLISLHGFVAAKFQSNAQGGKKLSNFFNRFYTFFSLFHTFFQIFLQLLTVFNRFQTRACAFGSIPDYLSCPFSIILHNASACFWFDFHYSILI